MKKLIIWAVLPMICTAGSVQALDLVSMAQKAQEQVDGATATTELQKAAVADKAEAHKAEVEQKKAEKKTLKAEKKLKRPRKRQ